MEEFKQGDRAWISAVWTKNELRNKVHTVITEVTITRIFEEDNSCLITDDENVGIHCKMADLYATKKEALEDVFKSLNRWFEMEE